MNNLEKIRLSIDYVENIKIGTPKNFDSVDYVEDFGDHFRASVNNKNRKEFWILSKRDGISFRNKLIHEAIKNQNPYDRVFESECSINGLMSTDNYLDLVYSRMTEQERKNISN